MLLVGPPKPDRSKDRGQTRFDPNPDCRLSMGLTTLSCKNNFVTETATDNLYNSRNGLSECSMGKDISKLSSFHTKNLRKIVRIFWPQIISNQDLFDEYQQESIETTIARRRWRWIGHILRKDQGSIPRVAVEWKPEGHRKRGRPKMTWRRTVEAEAKAMGHSWGTLRTLAQDRLRWREFVAALVVYDKKGSK